MRMMSTGFDDVASRIPVPDVEYVIHRVFWGLTGGPCWGMVTDGRRTREEALDDFVESFCDDSDPTFANCRVIRIDWDADVGGIYPAEVVTQEFIDHWNAAQKAREIGG